MKTMDFAWLVPPSLHVKKFSPFSNKKRWAGATQKEGKHTIHRFCMLCFNIFPSLEKEASLLKSNDEFTFERKKKIGLHILSTKSVCPCLRTTLFRWVLVKKIFNPSYCSTMYDDTI